MRLALVRQRYTPFGGAERFVERALAALGESGVAVSIYTRSWPTDASARATPVIVDPPYVGSLWRDWGFHRGVCRALAAAPAQLVQSHERVACCDIFRAGDGVHAVWLEERARAAGPLARLRQLANPYHRYTLRAEARLFASPRLKAVICNSRMVRDEIAQRFAVAGERLHVVYSAVDRGRHNPDRARRDRETLRARLGIGGGVTALLLVGSGYERKGVATALRALARVDDAVLVVVGRESRIGRYEALARALGVAGRVRFAGPQADPVPYYGAADAFVLPTLYDPLPNAALEAMACGLPVVTSTKSGAAELVEQWECGFVCAASDVAGLAARLAALRDPGLRATLGGRATAGIAALDPERMLAQLLSLYRTLLAAAEPAAASL
jgi:UDP-glucose:(heptosyl)LPS alpha-1,3-glucosyltransferase